MAAVLDESPVASTVDVKSWYAKSRTLWIDLVGDYAGKELFLIEGDSLLRECFEDKRIDFEGKFHSSPNLFVFSLLCWHAWINN
jgi:hypothetical protein